MNPYREPDMTSIPSPHEGATPAAPGSLPSPPYYPAPAPNPNSPPHPPVRIAARNHSSPPYQSPAHNASLNSAQALSPNSYPSSAPSRALAQDPGPNLATTLPPNRNPYLTPPSVSSTNPYQLSVGGLSLSPSPSSADCLDDSCPDLECAICFSQFNNVFRCPKMLQCKHTFCLECLARMNVKSAQPNSIQCPLCRGLTPLPNLGLPKLTTDPDVLSYLPAAMQRVYSIRFNRNKGKLQVKRSGIRHEWGRGQRSVRSVSHSLDVGLPSPPGMGPGGRQEERGRGVGGALLRLIGRPACRAFLLTSVVMMMALLTGIVIFLLTLR